MQETIERTTISLGGEIYASAKEYGAQNNLKFSQVVAEALVALLQAKGYLPEGEEERKDLIACRELRKSGFDPQPVLIRELEKRILESA